MSKKIVYEQPLNERIRAFLRLEFLFRQARHYVAGSSPWDSRAAMASIIEILTIFGRSDLKTEVMKELERHIAALARLEKNPDVDSSRLSELLDEMDVLVDRLHSMNGQIGSHLKQNEFLNSIRQRIGMPGGTCDFDLPFYHFWLEHPTDQRVRDLATWLSSFDSIAQAVKLILKLTRESALARPEVAEAGFYQRALDPNVPYQLVRVTVPSDLPYYAEISGGRHRFTVRFLDQASADSRPVQTDRDVEFELSCCVT